MLSIFFGHLVILILLLSWPFYNSKSSKLNKLASPFGKNNKRLLVELLIILSELFIMPL